MSTPAYRSIGNSVTLDSDNIFTAYEQWIEHSRKCETCALFTSTPSIRPAPITPCAVGRGLIQHILRALGVEWVR
jgi:hypothetical protein